MSTIKVTSSTHRIIVNPGNSSIVVVPNGPMGPRGLTGPSEAASILTTNGDILTRAAGVLARITRANLAADPAFTVPFGSTTYKLLPGETSWPIPDFGITAKVYCWGPGSGGGSGGKNSTSMPGGAGGGAGGVSVKTFLLSELRAIYGSAVPVTIGLGTAGGVAVTANTTAGNPSVAGASTTFGTPSTNLALSAQGGDIAPGAALSGTVTGAPAGTGETVSGTAGGTARASSPYASQGGQQTWTTGATGGGGGGQNNSLSQIAAAGGPKFGVTPVNNGVPGVGGANGANGGMENGGTGGGGGGGSRTSTPGGKGGDGGFPGGGGGGGGSGLDTTTPSSGAGGKGGDGAIYIVVL